MPTIKYYVIAAKCPNEDSLCYLTRCSVTSFVDKPGFDVLHRAYPFVSFEGAKRHLDKMKKPDVLEDLHIREIINQRVDC